MIDVKIKRFQCSPQGTAGALLVNRQFVCMTLELPWLGNTRNVSCIPRGSYIIRPWVSNEHGQVYRFDEVPGRSDILIHAGNFLRDTQGCILVGTTLIGDDDKLRLVESRRAKDKLDQTLSSEKEIDLIIA